MRRRNWTRLRHPPSRNYGETGGAAWQGNLEKPRRQNCLWLSRRQTMTQLEKGTFDGQEQDNGGGVNAKFDAEKSPNRRQRDVVARAKLRDEVHDDFLNQVCAVGDTGDEGRARNCNPTKRQSRTDSADEQRGHAESNKRELPDAGGHAEIIAFAEI